MATAHIVERYMVAGYFRPSSDGESDAFLEGKDGKVVISGVDFLWECAKPGTWVLITVEKEDV